MLYYSPMPDNHSSQKRETTYVRESSAHLAKNLARGLAKESLKEGAQNIQRLILKPGKSLSPELQAHVDKVQKTAASWEDYLQWSESIGQDADWFDDTFEYVENYTELTEQEQTDLMFELHSLVAHRKDLLSDINEIEYEQETGKKMRGQTVSVKPKSRMADAGADNPPSAEELAAFEQLGSVPLKKHHDLARKLGHNVGWFLEHFDQKVDAQSANSMAVEHTVKYIPGVGPVRVPLETKTTVNTEKQLDELYEQLNDVDRRLAKLGETPGLEHAYANKITRAYFVGMGAQRKAELEAENQQHEIEIDEITARALQSPQGAVTGRLGARLKQLRETVAENSKRAAALDKSAEGHAVNEHHLIRDYARSVSEGRMVEFPSAKAIVEDGLEQMRNHQPFMLAGHLGSGKTQLLRHMAKKFMIENAVDYDPSEINWEDPEELSALYSRLEPEIFSGSEEASIYDLVGKLKLSRENTDDPKILRKAIADAKEKLTAAGVNQIPDDKIAAIILGKEDPVETVFAYGPLGRAIRDGRPIIIDEINMIPAEVLGRLNAIILAKPGDKLRLQENGEEEFVIKPGLTFLASLNLGEQYTGIKQVNAAFKSRWVSKEADYPTAAETFDLITATLVRKDRVTFPPDFPQDGIEKMTDLTMAVREIQENFAGKTEGMSFMAMARSAGPEKSNLEQSVISTRDLMKKILEPWKRGNFQVEKDAITVDEEAITATDEDGNEVQMTIDSRSYDLSSLDTIIAKNILASEVFSKDDQKFMVEIFLRRGFFMGWTEEHFKYLGIDSVSDLEIQTLQGAMDTEEYSDAMASLSHFSDEIDSSNTSMIGARKLLIGAYNTRK